MAILGTYTASGSIVRASDGAFVPADPENLDYQALMAAVENGATITAYIAPTIDQVALDLATIEGQLADVGSFDRALFVLVLQQLNVLRAAVTALNTKTSLTGNAVPQIPLATAITSMQAAIRGSLPS